MEKKNNYIDFIDEIQLRNIKYLIHFTPTINLLSIFEQGRILSRALLEKNDIDDTLLDFIEFIDSIRFDDKNYINLSLSSPNYFLFNRFRERTQDKPYINWCVLKINPKYIYKSDTIFSVTNAASSIAKQTYGISGDIQKFRKLFENGIISKVGNLQRGNLKPKYPTDVQAEVLVKNEIVVSDILQVCFKDENDLATGKAALSSYDTSNFVVDASLFTNSRI
ncbi:DarT ssDNA thymidine ADP-ribosyltransferase family protein [Bergeyella porcorum]|uniref:DarT ssDNA thymidine ADP-ribosyltransferase family protein n=1 Tax=Bergeyella porcorum TaxID=1735111 RepID=UPI0035EE51C3